MRKKTKSIIAMGMVCTMLTGVLSGCGKEAEPAMNQQGDNTATNVALDNSAPLGNKDIDNTSPEVVGDHTEEDVNNNEQTSDTFTGTENENILLYSKEYEDKDYEALDKLQYNKYEVTIVVDEDIIVYNENGNEIGCVKKGGTINIIEATYNGEWARFENPFTESEYHYLYMPKMFVNAYAVGEPKTSPVTNEVPVETAKTDTPKTETPEINVPVEESTSIPTQAEPVVEENNKYTPEEAIAVWKSIIDNNGMIYDPSIKEFASWGTGFMYLDKGYPEQAAQWDLEGWAYGDGIGNSVTRYYFEVTGSDENCVYSTVWGCN